VLDPTLVRGLDYYSRTTFEFIGPDENVNSTICGGGRYDGLVEQLGGPPTPAAGWAAGVERILIALDEPEGEEERDVFVAIVEQAERGRAMALVNELRRAGISAELDLGDRGLKGQLKHADRIGARRTVILEGDGTAQLRDMDSGAQRPVEPGELVDELTAGERLPPP